jgi:hypothetical protein
MCVLDVSEMISAKWMLGVFGDDEQADAGSKVVRVMLIGALSNIDSTANDEDTSAAQSIMADFLAGLLGTAGAEANATKDQVKALVKSALEKGDKVLTPTEAEAKWEAWSNQLGRISKKAPTDSRKFLMQLNPLMRFVIRWYEVVQSMTLPADMPELGTQALMCAIEVFGVDASLDVKPVRQILKKLVSFALTLSSGNFGAMQQWLLLQAAKTFEQRVLGFVGKALPPSLKLDALAQGLVEAVFSTQYGDIPIVLGEFAVEAALLTTQKMSLPAARKLAAFMSKMYRSRAQLKKASRVWCIASSAWCIKEGISATQKKLRKPREAPVFVGHNPLDLLFVGHNLPVPGLADTSRYAWAASAIQKSYRLQILRRKWKVLQRFVGASCARKVSREIATRQMKMEMIQGLNALLPLLPPRFHKMGDLLSKAFMLGVGDLEFVNEIKTKISRGWALLAALQETRTGEASQMDAANAGLKLTHKLLSTHEDHEFSRSGACPLAAGVLLAQNSNPFGVVVASLALGLNEEQAASIQAAFATNKCDDFSVLQAIVGMSDEPSVSPARSLGARLTLFTMARGCRTTAIALRALEASSEAARVLKSVGVQKSSTPLAFLKPQQEKMVRDLLGVGAANSSEHRASTEALLGHFRLSSSRKGGQMPWTEVFAVLGEVLQEVVAAAGISPLVKNLQELASGESGVAAKFRAFIDGPTVVSNTDKEVELCGALGSSTHCYLAEMLCREFTQAGVRACISYGKIRAFLKRLTGVGVDVRSVDLDWGAIADDMRLGGLLSLSHICIKLWHFKACAKSGEYMPMEPIFLQHVNNLGASLGITPALQPKLDLFVDAFSGDLLRLFDLRIVGNAGLYEPLWQLDWFRLKLGGGESPSLARLQEFLSGAGLVGGDGTPQLQRVKLSRELGYCFPDLDINSVLMTTDEFDSNAGRKVQMQVMRVKFLCSFIGLQRITLMQLVVTLLRPVSHLMRGNNNKWKTPLFCHKKAVASRTITLGQYLHSATVAKLGHPAYRYGEASVSAKEITEDSQAPLNFEYMCMYDGEAAFKLKPVKGFDVIWMPKQSGKVVINSRHMYHDRRYLFFSKADDRWYLGPKLGSISAATLWAQHTQSTRQSFDVGSVWIGHPSMQCSIVAVEVEIIDAAPAEVRAHRKMRRAVLECMHDSTDGRLAALVKSTVDTKVGTLAGLAEPTAMIFLKDSRVGRLKKGDKAVPKTIWCAKDRYPFVVQFQGQLTAAMLAEYPKLLKHMSRSTMSASLGALFLFGQGRWSEAICEGEADEDSPADVLLQIIKGDFQRHASLNPLALASLNMLAKRAPGAATRDAVLRLKTNLWDLLGEVWHGYFKRTMTSGEQSLLRAIELSAQDNRRMGAQLAQLDLRGTASKDIIKLVMAITIEPGLVPGQGKTIALLSKRFGTKRIYPVLLTGLTSLCVASNVSAALMPMAKKLRVDPKTAELLCGLVALTKQDMPSRELAQRLGVTETLLKTMVGVSKGSSMSGERQYMASFLLDAFYPKTNTDKLIPQQCIGIFEAFCGRLSSLKPRDATSATRWKALDALLTIVAPHGPPLRLERYRAATALAVKLVGVLQKSPASAVETQKTLLQTQRMGVALLLQAGRKTDKHRHTVGEEAIMSITEQLLDCADTELIDEFPRALRVLLGEGRKLYDGDEIGKGPADTHYESSSFDTDTYDRRIRLGDMMKEAFDYISSANEPLPSASDNTELRGAKSGGSMSLPLQLEIGRLLSFNSQISKASMGDLQTFVDSIKRLTRLICRVFSLEALAAALFKETNKHEGDQCSLLVSHLLLLSKGTITFGSCTHISPVLDAILAEGPIFYGSRCIHACFSPKNKSHSSRAHEVCGHSDTFHHVARYLVGAVSGNMTLLRDHESVGAKYLLDAVGFKAKKLAIEDEAKEYMRKLVLLRHGTWAFTRHWLPSLRRDQLDVQEYAGLLKDLAKAGQLLESTKLPDQLFYIHGLIQSCYTLADSRAPNPTMEAWQVGSLLSPGTMEKTRFQSFLFDLTQPQEAQGTHTDKKEVANRNEAFKITYYFLQLALGKMKYDSFERLMESPNVGLNHEREKKGLWAMLTLAHPRMSMKEEELKHIRTLVFDDDAAKRFNKRRDLRVSEQDRTRATNGVKANRPYQNFGWQTDHALRRLAEAVRGSSSALRWILRKFCTNAKELKLSFLQKHSPFGELSAAEMKTTKQSWLGTMEFLHSCSCSPWSQIQRDVDAVLSHAPFNSETDATIQQRRALVWQWSHSLSVSSISGEKATWLAFTPKKPDPYNEILRGDTGLLSVIMHRTTRYDMQMYPNGMLDVCESLRKSTDQLFPPAKVEAAVKHLLLVTNSGEDLSAGLKVEIYDSVSLLLDSSRSSLGSPRIGSDHSRPFTRLMTSTWAISEESSAAAVSDARTVKNLNNQPWTASKSVQQWWTKSGDVVIGTSAQKYAAASAPEPDEEEKEQWDCFVEMASGEHPFNASALSPGCWTCNICEQQWQTRAHKCSFGLCQRPRGAESQYAQLERHSQVWWTKRNEKDRQAEKVLYSLLNTSPNINVASGIKRFPSAKGGGATWTSDPAEAFSELYAAAAVGNFVPKVQELLKARADNCQQVLLCEESPLLATMFKPRPKLSAVLETTALVSTGAQVACSLVDYVLKPNDKQSQSWLYLQFACPVMGLGQVLEVSAVTANVGAAPTATSSTDTSGQVRSAQFDQLGNVMGVRIADHSKALIVHRAPAQTPTIYLRMVQGVVEHDLLGMLDAVKPLVIELAPALRDDPVVLEVLLVWLKGLSGLAEKLKARELSTVWDDPNLQALLGQMMEGLLQLGLLPPKGATGHVPVEKLNALVTCTLAMATKRLPKLVDAGSLLFAGQLKPQQLDQLQMLLAFFGPIITKMSGQASAGLRSYQRNGGQDGQGAAPSEDGLKMVMKQLIAKVDTSGNGEISYDDFTDLLQMLQLPLPENSQKLLFAKVDIDGSGEIGEEEFMLATDLLVDELCEQTMTALHMSETDLVKLLVAVGSLLLTFFLFLYFGIESFTSGSSFSAVVNSAIAATGGGAGAAAGEEPKEDEEEDALHMHNPVGFAVEDALSAATTSE